MKEVIENLHNLYKHVASKDQTRFHLNGVMVEAPKDGHRTLVATDGHVLAVVELDSHIKPGYYSPEAIERMSFYLKQGDIGRAEEIEPDLEVRYPNWRQFEVNYNLDEKREIEKDEKELPVYTAIGLSPRLVDKLGKGLGLKKSDGMKFIIRNANSPVAVSVSGSTKRGVIMPMRI